MGNTVPKRREREQNVVLVADDNTFIRFLVKKWLGAEAEIIEVGNGQEVVEAYRRGKPDLVFLDIHLPGRNGKDVLAELVRMDPDAYVIMLSADSNKENVVQAVRNGAKAFVTKPFTRDTLIKYFQMCPTIVRRETAEGEEEMAAAPPPPPPQIQKSTLPPRPGTTSVEVVRAAQARAAAAKNGKDGNWTVET